jgi:hypothetical protein
MMFGPTAIGIWLLGTLGWLSLMAFLLTLAWRTVKAVERIACALERRAGG